MLSAPFLPFLLKLQRTLQEVTSQDDIFMLDISGNIREVGKSTQDFCSDNVIRINMYYKITCLSYCVVVLCGQYVID